VRQVTKRRPTRGRIATETLESSSARDTTEGILTAAPIVCRKARQGGGLGPAGKHEVCAARYAPSQLPVGSGTGQAVPAMTTRDVRDRDGRGERCSSR